MSIYLLLTIILIVATIPFIICGIKHKWNNTYPIIFIIIFGFCIITFGIISIIQPISLKKEMLRQDKERQQIIYQIKNLDENSDKIKLNEWILSYNDWINDVNTSKEVYGWFSWYYTVDMSKHKIIELV